MPQKSVPKKCPKKFPKVWEIQITGALNLSAGLVLKLKAASSAFERDEEQTAGVATILLTGEKSISQILLRN